MFVLVEVLLVLGVVAVLVCLAFAAASAGPRQAAQGEGSVGGRWQAAHYGTGGSTTVVVRKSAPGTGSVLDEHVVAVIPDGDPDYDARFLEAMALARSRVALFESEA